MILFVWGGGERRSRTAPTRVMGAVAAAVAAAALGFASRESGFYYYKSLGKESRRGISHGNAK